MFEYNADTSTSLLEAAVVQRQLLEQIGGLKHRDQFDWIHEDLIKHFQFLKQQSGKTDFHLSAVQDAGREDWGNVDYLADVAYNAGWNIHQLAVEDIGYNSETEKFVDLNDQPIEMLFKLYPLEWLSHAEFAFHIRTAETRFIEPAWKMFVKLSSAIDKSLGVLSESSEFDCLLILRLSNYHVIYRVGEKTIVRSRRCECLLLFYAFQWRRICIDVEVNTLRCVGCRFRCCSRLFIPYSSHVTNCNEKGSEHSTFMLIQVMFINKNLNYQVLMMYQLSALGLWVMWLVVWVQLRV